MLNKKLLEKAVTLHQEGQHEEAGRLYDEIARDNPNDPHVLHFQGLLAQHQGDLQKSVALISRAIKLKRDVPDFHKNIALSYEKLGDAKNAATAYVCLGNILLGLGDHEAARAAYDRSLELNPKDMFARGNRSLILHGAAAEEEHRKTIKSLGYKAKTADDFITLANSYLGLDDHEHALVYLDKAVKANPEHVIARYNRSFEILLNGDYEEGFREAEWRWHNEAIYPDKTRMGFSQPVWEGASPEILGGPLLVIAEQAFGDHIQFARYALVLAQRGYKVLFEVQRPIFTLFAEGLRHPNLRVIPQQFTRWEEWGLPSIGRLLKAKPRQVKPDRVFRNLPFVAYCGVQSVPYRIGTTIERVPAEVPYLSVEESRVKAWAARLSAASGKFKVGLIWGGNVSHLHDSKRSVPPVLLEPLLRREGIAFFSLQKDAAGNEFSAPITYLGPELKDWNDTAAIMQNLDLIISVDTAPAHLAGALARPVWIMIPKVKDWRWGKEGSASPWYPTARLFRQKVQGEWGSVIEEVSAALDELAGRHAQ